MPGKKSYLFASILIFFTHYSFGQSQIVSGVFSSTEISAGDTPTLTISYQATSAAKTTGLGLRLHFDSSKLQIGGVTLNLNEAAQAVQVVDDSSDLDGDSSTDKIILTSWSDTTGDGWPQSASQPTVLYAVPFTALGGFDGTTIKFTASYTAAGYAFSASDISLNLSPIVVEAENYTAKIQNDDNKPEATDTSDVGGGQSLGWIDAGDWTEYSLPIDVAGNYRVDYRVAAKGGPSELDIKIDDLNRNFSNYDLADFGGNTSALVADPTDTTNEVVAVIKGAETWSGTRVSNGSVVYPITATHSAISVRVWSPKAGISVKMKLEESEDNNHSVETDALTTKVGEWETLVFDFSNPTAGTSTLNSAHVYDSLSVYFDFGSAGSSETYYFDDIVVTGIVEVTANYDGGYYYIIDGVAKRELQLVRGNRYIFKYPSSHPMRFSMTADGIHNGDVEYTQGVDKSATNQISLTLDSDSPTTLYYYCQLHANMGGAVSHLGADKLVDRVKIVDTGGWQNWETVRGRVVALTAGEKVLRFEQKSGSINLNWLKFTKTLDSVSQTPAEEERSNQFSLVGNWRLAPEAGAMQVGPSAAAVGNWWSSDESLVTSRACFYDDIFRFGADGSFANVMGFETWVESWQGIDSDQCGSPVAPHDGSASATYTYDASTGSLTINGLGAHLGLPKVYNGGELSNPADAPSSVTYTVTAVDSQNMTVQINYFDTYIWQFKLKKLPAITIPLDIKGNGPDAVLNTSDDVTVSGSFSIDGKVFVRPPTGSEAPSDDWGNSSSRDLDRVGTNLYFRRFTHENAVLWCESINGRLATAPEVTAYLLPITTTQGDGSWETDLNWPQQTSHYWTSTIADDDGSKSRHKALNTYDYSSGNGVHQLQGEANTNTFWPLCVGDEYSDTDGDGIADVYDAFPNDGSEMLDTDSDGTGNNADADDDDDGVLDAGSYYESSSIVGIGSDGRKFGHAVTLSANSKVMAVSHSNNDRVNVYDWISDAWVQRGTSIYISEERHKRLSLSANGNILVVSSPHSDQNNNGSLEIFRWNSSSWDLLEDRWIGDYQAQLGSSISLSDNGEILAVGYDAYYGFNGTGSVKIFDLVGSQFDLRSSIIGEAANDLFGASIDLSSDGKILAVGAYGNDGNGGSSGHVRVMYWTGSAWTQLGQDIDGLEGERTGYSVSLSADGTTVAIGALEGSARVYNWSNNQWSQKGATLQNTIAENVSLSADGQVIAISNSNSDGPSLLGTGKTVLYRWMSTSWQIISDPIYGQKELEFSGTSIALADDASKLVLGVPLYDGSSQHQGAVRTFLLTDPDTFPLDANESIDTDSDGIGNNSDFDDDNDGLSDTDEARLGTNPLVTDSDGDGVIDGTDVFPADASETIDTDSDGVGNNEDTDDDNDGVQDSADAFPLDSNESLDTDLDGVGNNTDTDDDNDGISDSDDDYPLNDDILDRVSAAALLDINKEAVIPSRYTQIGDRAFLNSTIRSVTIPDSVTVIGEQAFDSSDLRSVTWGSGLTNIKNNAFKNSDITELELPSSVTVIGESSFSSLLLTKLVLNDGLITIGNNAFLYSLRNSSGLGHAGPETVTIPDTVRTISQGAFYNSGVTGSIKNVIFGEGLTSIGSNAFIANPLAKLMFKGNRPDLSVSGTFTTSSVEDLDGDGVLDFYEFTVEYCANKTGWPGDDFVASPGVNVSPKLGSHCDSDGDGVADSIDIFPLDGTETLDNDSDGIGDNLDIDDDNDGVVDVNDAFPLDALETVDTDSDGTGNNADTDDDNDGVLDEDDAFPLDANESLDSDGDGVGDNADDLPNDATETLDSDGDGVGNNTDAFPNDATETVDTDSDGIGNNADPDDDNDGVDDSVDAFPLDGTETVDTDADGVGNNADPDDDNDGVLDGNDAYPLISLGGLTDTDGDGIPDNCDSEGCVASGMTADSDDDNDGVEDTSDAFPLDATESIDTDADGIGNNADPDDDNDGVSDAQEALDGTDPLDPISVDTDHDGILDSNDIDDDGDGVPDDEDAFPLDESEASDFDSDGTGDNADLDDDNDGVEDLNDVFPFDAAESLDTDSDGVGNNADTDDDGDGVLDADDAFPVDATETIDTDGDGIGNNADPDDDSDGLNDEYDAFPLDPTEYRDSDSDGVGDNSDAFPNNALYTLDSDSDGIADAWEIKYSFDPNDASDASEDYDNDGLSALEEFLEGSIPLSLDLDADLRTDALTDGLLLLRGMFGIDGDPLILGAVSTAAAFDSADEIQQRIQNLGNLIDADGNGSVDALTDGLLILRFLFGLSGDELVTGVLAPDATRDSTEVYNHLIQLTPQISDAAG